MSGLDGEIVEYRGLEGLRRLEDPWKRLYQKMPERSRYHMYEGHHAYLAHLCRDPGSARYLAFVAGGEVRAICPLEAGVQKIAGVKVPVWALPRHNEWVVTDVVAPEDETRAALVPALLRFVRQHDQRPVLLALGPLPADSHLWQRAPELSPADRLVHTTSRSYVFDCEQPFESLLGKTSAKFRENLRRAARKARALGDMQFVTETTGAGNGNGHEGAAARPPDALDVMMAVEASGWKGEQGAGTAIRLDPRAAGFYREFASVPPGPQDRCEIISLYAAGRCIASSLCLKTGHEYAGLKIGYDPEFRQVSPGHLLVEEILRRCCADSDVRRLNVCTAPPWVDPWRPDAVQLVQYHFGVRPASARPALAALRLRYGPGRRLVAEVRRWKR